ncbi:MAG: ATP-dependent zinc metalloprotease FtsH [Spirochaetia bacterium]
MAGNDNRKEWKKNKDPKNDKQFKGPEFHFSIWYFVGALVIMALLNAVFFQNSDVQTVEYSRFKDMVRQGQIETVEMGSDYYIGVLSEGPESTSMSAEAEEQQRVRTTPVEDPNFLPLLEEQNITYYRVPEQSQPLLELLIYWIAPFVILIFIWRYLFSRMEGMGSGVMQFGKNKSRLVAEGETGVEFSDVAGVDESKAELEEVVDFLKKPKKYIDVGGRIPTGVLLIGAPGTGKTLLAKAVAGEAGVPFFRLSGADFVEMFVGVGAARVRDLFTQAKDKAPCIIFIDELDAIGKNRQASIGSNDEREQTLNQLLVEMDGFDSRTGVIILAATNRPETLDPALMRAGRFDRQVLVDKPDLEGREAILKIHTRNVKLTSNVNLLDVAKGTPGLVGADLANIVNEAALIAVRNNRDKVEQGDFEDAIEKVFAGLQKKKSLSDPVQRKRVAYHEMGHALVAGFTDSADSVQKISIIPRGMGALGFTRQIPEEEKYLLTQSELIGKLDVMLGGRASEELVLGEISTGASDDLSRASELVRKMITEYGMSEKFKNVALPYKKSSKFLGDEYSQVNREYSEDTQKYIDSEVARIVDERYSHVKNMLQEKRGLLEKGTQQLLEKENLTKEEFQEILRS